MKRTAAVLSCFNAPLRLALLAAIVLLIHDGLAPGTAQAQGPREMADPPDLDIPIQWVDADTGHLVVRLSRGPGNYRSFYFHNYPFFKNDSGNDMMMFNGTVPDDADSSTPTGQQYWTSDPTNSIYTVNLRTGQVLHLTKAPSRQIVGHTSPTAYCQTDDNSAIIGVDLLTGRQHKIIDLQGKERSRFDTLNVDDTLMAGTFVEDPWPEGLSKGKTRGEWFNATFQAKQMRRLEILDLKTGQCRTLLRQRHWLNHLQFSPTDPKLLMYCHEGPWHQLDRIWTIRIDSGATEGTRMFARSVENEIWGHEWWDPSGQTIWCDHQIPVGETFFVMGIDVNTLETRNYELTRSEWSVHYTYSPQRNLFAGDGGSPNSVAGAKDGQWIYLFRPNDQTMRLESERLVNLKDHDYTLEPNLHFTPDQKWLVFGSNMHGREHVYAVQIDRASE